MNIDNIVNGDSTFSVNKIIITHNLSGKVEEKFWMKLRGLCYYEDLVQAGITSKRYMTLLLTKQVETICYLVKNYEQLEQAFMQMEVLKEIYSPVPIRIACQSEDDGWIKIPDRYKWIKGLEIEYFNMEQEEDVLDWLLRDVNLIASGINVRIDTNFYDKEMLLKDYMKKINRDNIFTDGSLYMGGFFRSLLYSKELYHSVMLGYDFVEFILSMVHYYYKAKQGEDIREHDILGYKIHALEILRLSKGMASEEKLHNKKIKIDFLNLSSINDKIKKYYGITVTGDSYNFLGLVDVFQKIRNRTRGHGVIVGKSGYVLWDVIYNFIFMLMYYLDIEDFSIVLMNNKVYAGYKDGELVCLEPFVVAKRDVPCVIYQVKKNGKREYINYFYGEYAIPDIVTVP